MIYFTSTRFSVRMVLIGFVTTNKLILEIKLCNSIMREQKGKRKIWGKGRKKWKRERKGERRRETCKRKRD